LTPSDRLAADTVGGELLTVIVGELVAVALELVETVKLKFELGLVALNPTETVAPAAIPAEQDVLLRVITNGFPLLVVPPPLCRHEPETTVTPVAVSATALLCESPMVIVPPDATDPGDTNVSVYPVVVPESAVVGETVRLVTAPDGVPMVYGLLVTAANAGRAVTAATVPKAPIVSARVPATSLARLHPRPGVIAEGFCSCI
jgi:hypothetical protein